MITEICIDAILIDMYYFHDSALLDEKEVFALGPSILEGVAKDLSLFEEGLILLVEFI